MKATQRLHDLGQSLWLDNITRDLLDSGTLRRYIDEWSVTGPHVEPDDLRSGDQEQCVVRRSDPERAGGRSLRRGICSSISRWTTSPVPPTCSPRFTPAPAASTDGCRSKCRRCSRTTRKPRPTLQSNCMLRAARPNLFIKIPGTAEGLRAIEEATFAGVPINVTLLFSREQYIAAADAHLRGIERRIAAGLSADVASVASVFISRWDVSVASKVHRDDGPQYTRHRDRPTLLQGLLRSHRVAALSARAEQRRPAATSAVCEHRHERSEGVGRAVRKGVCGAADGEHDSGGDAESVRGPRRGRRDYFRRTAAIARR